MAMHIYWGSGDATPNLYLLPTGATITVVGNALVARVKESVELPSGAVLNIQAAAPVLKTKENFNLSSAGIVSIVAQAASKWKVKESVQLATGSVVIAAGSAPILRTQESTQLVTGAVSIQTNPPKFQLNEVCLIPAGSLTIVANTPSTTLDFRQFELPHGVVNLRARKPYFLLRPASEVGTSAGFIDLLSLTVGTLAAIEAFHSEIPSGVIEIEANSVQFRNSVSTAIPQGEVVIEANTITFRATDVVNLPTGSIVASAIAATMRLSESSGLPSGVVNLLAQTVSWKVNESTSLVAGNLNIQANSPASIISEDVQIPTGAVLEIEGNASSIVVSVGFHHISSLPVGLLNLVGQQPVFVITTTVEVTEDEPKSGGFAEYESILWPKEWAKPFLSVCVLPSANIKIWGYAPKSQVTQHQFTQLPRVYSQVRAFPIEFSLSGNLETALPSGNISTKSLPPAIIVEKRIAYEDELLCLLYLL